MLTVLLIGFPLLAALLLFFVKGENVKHLALGASIIEFLISVVAVIKFSHDPYCDLLNFNVDWVGSLGIHFAVSLDSLSILLVMLTTFLVPLIILTSYHTVYPKANS